MRGGGRRLGGRALAGPRPLSSGAEPPAGVPVACATEPFLTLRIVSFSKREPTPRTVSWVDSPTYGLAVSLAGLGSKRRNPCPPLPRPAPHPRPWTLSPQAGSGPRALALAPPLPGEQTMREHSNCSHRHQALLLEAEKGHEIIKSVPPPLVLQMGKQVLRRAEGP